MKLIIDSRDELRIVDLNEVVYMKASGNYTDFHFANGMVKSELSCLSDFEQQIGVLYNSRSPFFRVGRSHVVNVDYIVRISLQSQKVYFSSGDALTLPKHRLRQLKERIVSRKTFG